MIVTKNVFAAYLNCQTKAYLKSLGTPHEPIKFGAWRTEFEDNLRQEGLNFLKKQNSHNVLENVSTIDPSAKGSVLYINCAIDNGEIASLIDAVEKIELHGHKTRLIPCRYLLHKSAERHEKLLLAYDAHCLKVSTRTLITVGKLVDGPGKRVKKVYLQSLLGLVQDSLPRLTELLRQEKEPPLILNNHCVECEFRLRCREKALEKDDLSLLTKMSLKERKKLHSKGLFTVTQLSYTFRPRRRPKNRRSQSDKFSYPLKALAIRENKIHVAGAPAFTVQDKDCFLDIEYIPEAEFYYLIGLRCCLNGRSVQHSFWAHDHVTEEKSWKDLLGCIHEYGFSRIIHFGSPEKRFFQTMSKRYCNSEERKEYVEKLIDQSVNLLAVIYSQIYFPTYSNSLKDIGQYLGHRWPDEISNGYEALLARHHWDGLGDENVKESLLIYNASDCEALQLVAHCISQLCSQLSTLGPVEHFNVVDTNKLRGWGPFKFGPVNFSSPDFEYINRASYWDYQRERIVIRSQGLSKRRSVRRSIRKTKCPINKVIECSRSVVCPTCKSRKVYKYGLMRRNVYDLKFFSGGLKRWALQYRYNRHICWTCKRTFMPRSTPRTRSKFGESLVRFVVFLIVDLQISQSAATRLITQFCGLELSRESAGRLKSTAAEFYKFAYKKILRQIVQSHIVHVDETKVSLNGRSAYVWVLANQENVAYFWSDNREGEKVHTILKDFKGVLLSDFYGVYDSFECAQQRCLIHLMRDLNDDLLREPFNEELKLVGNGFSSVLKPIIETIDRYGLKRRFMNKHRRSVDGFWRWLAKANLETEIAAGYRKRFEKNREKLFTFMDYDDVPWNNNTAEHAIKAFATLRRVFGGHSTERSLQDYLVLLSVCETCHYRGIDFWKFLSSGYKDVDAYQRSVQRGQLQRRPFKLRPQLRL
jgi:predicted RecB family nuclease